MAPSSASAGDVPSANAFMCATHISSVGTSVVCVRYVSVFALLCQ
jgi:hypothetical protein